MKSFFISTMAVIALLTLLFIKPVKNILNYSDSQVKKECVLTADQVQPLEVPQSTVIKNHELMPDLKLNTQEKVNAGINGKEVGLVPRLNAARFIYSSNQFAFNNIKIFKHDGKPGGL